MEGNPFQSSTVLNVLPLKIDCDDTDKAFMNAQGSLASDPVETIYVDAACLIAIKPSGLLAVPGRGEAGRDCLAARVQQRFADALVVHRLDMATSGLMAFARGGEAQRALNRAFADRAVVKTYVAVVDGLVVDEHGDIDLPLQADWPNRPRQKVDVTHGKAALTHYRVLSRDERRGTTRLALQPVTGRAHQLRVHACAIGHPILGDTLYAPSEVQARSTRLLLHAERLVLPHPWTRIPIECESPAPF